MVKAVGCSSSLLERYFRKTVGRTIVQELQRVRLEKACDLLRHSETPIGEIGPLCGYEDETYFKIIFRRAYGKSMRAYRRDARQEGDAPQTRRVWYNGHKCQTTATRFSMAT